MGDIIYMDAYKLMQNLIKNAHFLKNECVYLSTHRAIDPCQKLNFYEISQVVPFLIAGHISTTYLTVHCVPPVRVTVVFTVFPMPRLVPYTIRLVPPACGPRDGNTPVIWGETMLNCAIDVAAPLDSIMLTVSDPIVPPLLAVMQLIIRPGMYPLGLVGVQATPPTWMELPGAVKSLNDIPRSVPRMVIVVPPSGGPYFGLKSEILGAAQSDLIVIGIAPLHTPPGPE